MRKHFSSGSEQEQASGNHLNPIPAAAKRLGVSPFTLRKLIREGHLRGVRIGRRVMVAESTIAQAIENGVGKFV